MADYAGQQLGNYKVLHLIGRGGFADVYLGEHLYLKVPVALKVLSSIVANQEDVQGFLKEAQTVARLVHPHIIRVTDFGVERDIPFLVMDYAPHGTLRQRHPRGTRVPLSPLVSYIMQVVPALQYAHDERVIHRDVKPENLLLGRHDQVLLSDFGIALMTQSSRYKDAGEMMGTVPYMAPEQIQGKPQPASDQYALAVIVYEWLSGERLFQGSYTEVAMQHILAPPPPLREKVPTLPSAVEEVVRIALAKDPQQRFKSVTAFAQALEQASRAEEPFRPASGDNSSHGEEESAGSASPMPTETRAGAGGSEKDGQEGAGRKEQVGAGQALRIERGQFVAMALGILLYGGANIAIDTWYKAASPLATTTLSVLDQSIDSGIVLAGLVLIVPLVVAATWGPLAAFVTILAGQYLGDLIAGYSANSDYYGGSWSWLVGRILIGLVAGLAVVLTRGHYTTARSLGIAFALGTVGIVVGTAFTAYADIWLLGRSAADAGTSFTILVLPALLAPLLLVLVLFARSRILPRRQV